MIRILNCLLVRNLPVGILRITNNMIHNAMVFTIRIYDFMIFTLVFGQIYGQECVHVSLLGIRFTTSRVRNNNNLFEAAYRCIKLTLYRIDILSGNDKALLCHCLSTCFGHLIRHGFNQIHILIINTCRVCLYVHCRDLGLSAVRELLGNHIMMIIRFCRHDTCNEAYRNGHASQHVP